MNTCYSCKAAAVQELYDFGRLPVCNRFLSSPSDGEAAFPFILNQCSACGLVQVSQPVPSVQLRSRYDWVTYNEPSAHLNDLVARVAALPGVTTDSPVCGIFLPTDPTLSRFADQGFTATWRLDIQSDLNVPDVCAGTETIQAKLDQETAELIKGRRGAPDVVVIRHVLEHAHDIGETLRGVKSLVQPKGYVVFEVPNCGLHLKSFDYTTLWEEHVLYFTLETFLSCLQRNGFQIVHHEQVGVSLLAIAKPVTNFDAKLDYSVSDQLHLGQAFAESFPSWKQRTVGYLSKFKQNQGNIAVFGAGHLSCTFVNLLHISGLISCIIDDHEKKQHMFMPGSKLPILPSSALIDQEIKLCLSSLGEQTDIKVAQKNAAFLAKGGRFASIFPGTNYFLGT